MTVQTLQTGVLYNFHAVIIMLLSPCTGQTDEEGQRDAASDSAERQDR